MIRKNVNLVFHFAFLTTALVEFVTTSTENFKELPKLKFIESTLSTYCDTDYYVKEYTAQNAGNQCGKRCSELQGYVNSDNELVCFKSHTKAVAISKNDDPCVCGYQTPRHNDRERCYPPVEFGHIRNQKACNALCSERTVTRGKKLPETIYKVMWCGSKINEEKIIKKLDGGVKLVGEFPLERTTVPISICHCGSKTIKAKTFLSEETRLKMEDIALRKSKDDWSISCSFGSFWIPKLLSKKCKSTCTITKAYFLPDTRELICYHNAKDATGLLSYKEVNDKEITDQCLCGASFEISSSYAPPEAFQPCNPVRKIQNIPDINIHCRRMCSKLYKAYIVEISPTEKKLVRCEPKEFSPQNIFSPLDFEVKKEAIGEDYNDLMECQCGLRESSLMRYKIEIRNRTIPNATRGIVNGGEVGAKRDINLPRIQINREASFSSSMNQYASSPRLMGRSGNSKQISSNRTLPRAEIHRASSSRTGSAIHIASSPQMMKNGGSASQIARSSQKGNSASSARRPISSRNGQPLTFNRGSSSSKARNIVRNRNDNYSRNKFHSLNREERCGISADSSRKTNNSLSRKLNNDDKDIFGEILKNTTFPILNEEELFRTNLSNDRTIPAGFSVPVTNSHFVNNYSSLTDNRGVRGSLSDGSSRIINRGDSSSSRKLINHEDSDIFGDILKNSTFPTFSEKELLRNNSSKNLVNAVGLKNTPNPLYPQRKAASSSSSQASSVSIKDTATSKFTNRYENEIVGEQLDDIPFPYAIGHQHPPSIDTLMGFSPVGDYVIPSNCQHKRKRNELPPNAIFPLPDFSFTSTFPLPDIVLRDLSSSGPSQSGSCNDKRMKN